MRAPTPLLLPDGAADAAYDANVDAPLPDGHGPLACRSPPHSPTPRPPPRAWAAGFLEPKEGAAGAARAADGSAVVGVLQLSTSPQGAGGYTE